MFGAILKGLNIEQRESQMVLLLVFQSFFIGVFFATLENSATTLFMMQYGKEMLGNAYLTSGLLGMVLTGLFSFFQNKIRYSTLSTINLIIITLLTFAMWYSFYYTDSEWLVFGIFSLMGALYILAIVGFSGLASRLFTLRQGKRLFSIIDSGLVFGMIVISLAIPFILQILPDLKDLILISSISIFVALIFQIGITAKYDVNKRVESANTEAASGETEKVGLAKFFKDRYIFLMSLFVMLSMVTLFFTAYNFLTVGKINYPDSNDFAIFFANFTIAVMAFSFIIKTFIYSKLMKTYGLKVSLLVVPILIGFFAIVAGIIGTIFGYETESASFVIFFLLLSLVRFFAINLKDSILAPSLKILFQPLGVEIRYNVQAKIEGLVNEISAVLSGIILAGLGALSFMELINYSHILIFIIAAWIYVTFQLYKEYQNTLKRSLIEYKQRKEAVTSEDNNQIIEAEAGVNSYSFQKIQRSLDIMKEYEPTLFDLKLGQLLTEKSIAAKELAIKSIDEAEIFGAISELKNIAKSDPDENIKKLANEVRIKLEKSYKEYIDEEKILYLARSKNEDDRIKAAKIIGDSENHELSSLLKNLLKDLVPQVKLQAINSVVKLNNKELWPALIDQMTDPQYRSAARSAILGIGEPILESLEKAYYKSGSEPDLLVTIVELYGKIGGEKAIKYLLKKLNDPNRQIVLAVLNSLRSLKHAVTQEAILSQIFQAIEQNVGITSWNFAAKFDVEEQGFKDYMSKSLERELSANYNMIFLLLSLAYDPQSIQHIRENIESGTTEGVSFAIEMLDLVVAEQLKTTLFPLFEDNRPEEKIHELELLFPINLYGNKDVLRQIMNRSANFLNNFTRSCAIYSFLDLEEDQREITNDIVSNLFNTDPLLRETAAIVMHSIDPNRYEVVKERLSINQQEQLEKSIINYQKDKHSILIEKVIFLNQMDLLFGLSQRLMEDLAIVMLHRKAPSGMTLISKAKSENNYYFIVSGTAEFKINDQVYTFGANQVINDMIFLDTDPKEAGIITQSEIEYFEISADNFKGLLFRYPELGDIMLNVFDIRMSGLVGIR